VVACTVKTTASQLIGTVNGRLRLCLKIVIAAAGDRANADGHAGKSLPAPLVNVNNLPPTVALTNAVDGQASGNRS
jgi:hypothetical protein